MKASYWSIDHSQKLKSSKHIILANLNIGNYEQCDTMNSFEYLPILLILKLIETKFCYGLMDLFCKYQGPILYLYLKVEI